MPVAIASQVRSFFGSVRQITRLTSFLFSSLGSVSLVGGIFCVYKAYIQGTPSLYLPLDTEWQKTWQERVTQPEKAVQAVTVEVAGAVEKPGVFTLSPGARVQDAILQAGGFLVQANQAFIHQDLRLAALLTDQEKIYIPFQSEKPGEYKLSQPEQGESSKKSVNSLTKAELMEIAGIGEARSEAVLEGVPYSSRSDFLERSQLPDSIANDVLDNYSL